MIDERDLLKPHVTLRERLRALEKKLRDGDWETQVGVINELGNIPREEAIALLIDFYELDSTSSLGRQIKQVLLGYRSRIISPLISILKNSSRETKPEVVELLVQLDVSEQAAAAFLKAYAGSDGASQRSLKNALKALDRDKVIDFTLSVFRDPDTPHRGTAFEILEDLEGIHDREELVSKFNIPAAGSLPDTQEDFQAVMGNRIESYRFRVVEEIAISGDEKYIPSLKLALRDSSLRVREKAVEALGELYNEEVIDPLIEGLEGEEEHFVILSLRGLIKFANLPKVVSTMMKRVDNPNKNIAALATIALARKARSDHVSAQEIGDETTATMAAGIMSDLVDRLVEMMREHILSLRTEVQLDVAAALIDLKYGGRVEGILINALSSSNRELRAAVALMLGQVGGMRSMSALIKTIEDPDKRVRANIIESLEMIAPERIKDLLQPFLADPDNRVRANAAKALYKGGDVRGLGILMSMLGDPDELMRLSAAWTLGQIGNRIALKALAEAEETEEQEHIKEIIRKFLPRGSEETASKDIEEEEVESENTVHGDA